VAPDKRIVKILPTGSGGERGVGERAQSRVRTSHIKRVLEKLVVAIRSSGRAVFGIYLLLSFRLSLKQANLAPNYSLRTDLRVVPAY